MYADLFIISSEWRSLCTCVISSSLKTAGFWLLATIRKKNLFHNFRGSEQENLVGLTQQRKTEDEFFIISNF